MVVGLAGGVVSIALPQVSEAKVARLVRAAEPRTGRPSGAALTSDQISRTYASLMTEPPLLAKVIQDLQLHSDPSSLAREIQVTPLANTTILNVAVQNTNPALARDIANTLVQDFIQEVRQ